MNAGAKKLPPGRAGLPPGPAPPPRAAGGAHAPSRVAGCALTSGFRLRTPGMEILYAIVPSGFSARARKTAPEGGCAPRNFPGRARLSPARRRQTVRTLGRRGEDTAPHQPASPSPSPREARAGRGMGRGELFTRHNSALRDERLLSPTLSYDQMGQF